MADFFSERAFQQQQMTPQGRRQIDTQKQNQVSRQQIRNAPDANMRAYLEARRRGDWEAAGRFQRQRQQQGQFNREMDQFDTLQQEGRDELLDLFRQESELRKARATGGVQTAVSSQLAARGIRGPAEAAAVQRTEQALMSQMAQEQSDFTSKLAQIQSAQRQGFIQNQFHFFHELDRMAVAHNYQKDLIDMQAQIQSDQNKWNIANQVMGLAGAAAMTFFNPVAGVAAATGAAGGGGSFPFAPANIPPGGPLGTR